MIQKINTSVSSWINRSSVLTLIHNNPMISRSELSKIINLQRSTITHILNYLISQNLVEEIDRGKSGELGGRRPILLRIKYNSRYIISIQIDPVYIKTLVSDLAGTKVLEMKKTISRNKSMFAVLCQTIDNLKDKMGEDFKKCAIMGISTPGIIDFKKGIMVLNTLFGWKNESIAAPLTEKYGIPVFIENDCNAAGMGEIKVLKNDNNESILYMMIRKAPKESRYLLGIGGSMILNNRIWRGSHSYSGEVSKTINDLFFEEKSRECIKSLRKIPDDHVDINTIIDMAKKKNKNAEYIFSMITDKVSMLLSDLSAFIDPGIIILNVDFKEDCDIFSEAIKESFLRHHSDEVDSPVNFIFSELKSQAITKGLIAMAQERIFVSEISQSSLLIEKDE